MSVQNNIISMTDVSINDPKNVLGVDSYELRTICQHPNVNKYSRCKPVPNDVNTDTGLLRAYINASSKSTDISQLENNLEWSRIPITNNFRLGDFAGYNHNSKNPFTSTIGMTTNMGKASFGPRIVYIPKMNINQDDAWFFFGCKTKKKMIPVCVVAIKKNTYTKTDYIWCCAPISSVPDSFDKSFNFYIGFDIYSAPDFQWVIPVNGNGKFKWLFTMISIDDATRLIGEGVLKEEVFTVVGESFNGLLRDNDNLYFNDIAGGNGMNSDTIIKHPSESLIYIEYLYPSRFANGTDQYMSYQIYGTNSGVCYSGRFLMDNQRPYDGVLYRKDLVIPVPSAIKGTTYEIRFQYSPILTTNDVAGFTTAWVNYGTVTKNWNRYSLNSPHYCDLTLPLGKNIIIRNS